ncbi:MAG TPA: lysylphosphatidylglycerol synthase transmembrane domain-containing protein, partial [Bdellovibrionota bacterium]
MGQTLMQNRFLPWLKLFLKFAFAFVILWYMIYSGRLDLAVVRQGFAHRDYLLGSVGLVLFSLSIGLYRWKLLLEGQGVLLGMGEIVRYGMIGAFFNTTMPGAVSGDIIKAWYVIADRAGQRKTPVLTSVLLDRVMGVFGLVLVSASPVLIFWSTVWSTPTLHSVA